MQDLMAMRLMDTMTEYSSNEVTSVISNGFARQTNLKKISLPNCTVLTDACFQECTGLQEVYLPKLQSMPGTSTFHNCSSLKEFITTNAFDSRINARTFNGCSALEKVDFYHIHTMLGISSDALNCKNLVTVIIRNTDAVPPLNATAFGGESTKMNTGEGKIYVPASMVDAYKSAANWSKYADQIYSIEELTE